MMTPDDRLIQIAEDAFAEARRRAGAWITCGPGCGECCHRPFPITQADAERLREGLRQADAAVAEDIERRAVALWRRMERDFPGDAAAGELTGNEEWREWFFQRLTGQACPVLDEATQACRLYAHRPMACRLAGPLIQAGEGTFPPCPKNYVGATKEQIEATRVVLDDPLFHEPPDAPETLVAWVTSQYRRSKRSD